MVSKLHLTDRPPRVHRTHHVFAGNLLDVATAREVVTLTRRRPYEGDETVIHLTAAHRATAEIWNVLLKPIEEPPDFVQFHIYAPSVDQLPKTIKTRCHVTRENLPQTHLEDVTRLLRLCESRDALMILREGDRAGDLDETVRVIESMWDSMLKNGRLKAAAYCEAHLELLRAGCSPRIALKSLLLMVAQS